MDENLHHQKFRATPILIGLLGVIAGAIMVATYHLIHSFCNCHRRQIVRTTNNTNQNVHQRNRPRDRTARSSSSTTQSLVPVLRYNKDCNEDMCAVCLGEFKDGEQIRVLPDCLHLFHVVCIDRWLSLHSNCPICRTEILLPKQEVVTLPDSSRTSTVELNRLPDFGV